jgi:hypothetical protein
MAEMEDYTANFKKDKLITIMSAIIDGEITGLAFVLICTPKRIPFIESVILPIIDNLLKSSYLVLAIGCGNSILEVNEYLGFKKIDDSSINLKAFCNTHNIPPVTLFGACFSRNHVELTINQIISNIYSKNLVFKHPPLIFISSSEVEREDSIEDLFPVVIKKIDNNSQFSIQIKSINQLSSYIVDFI